MSDIKPNEVTNALETVPNAINYSITKGFTNFGKTI